MLYTSNLQYKPHQMPKLECYLLRFEVDFAQSIEARCLVENEDVVGAVAERQQAMLQLHLSDQQF